MVTPGERGLPGPPGPPGRPGTSGRPGKNAVPACYAALNFYEHFVYSNLPVKYALV